MSSPMITRCWTSVAEPKPRYHRGRRKRKNITRPSGFWLRTTVDSPIGSIAKAPADRRLQVSMIGEDGEKEKRFRSPDIANPPLTLRRIVLLAMQIRKSRHHARVRINFGAITQSESVDATRSACDFSITRIGIPLGLVSLLSFAYQPALIRLSVLVAHSIFEFER